MIWRRSLTCFHLSGFAALRILEDFFKISCFTYPGMLMCLAPVQVRRQLEICSRTRAFTSARGARSINRCHLHHVMVVLFLAAVFMVADIWLSIQPKPSKR